MEVKLDNLFTKLKKDICFALKKFKISQDSVVYVSLNNDYWISFDAFMSLTQPPKVWRYGDFGSDPLYTEWYLPKGFHIMFDNNKWMAYHVAPESTYSDFMIYHYPPKPYKLYVTQPSSKQNDNNSNHNQSI